MDIDGINVTFRKRELNSPEVAEYLAERLAEKGSIMIHRDSRLWKGKSHLRLYHDGKGYHVKIGRGGSCKAYLVKCEITVFDGKPDLWQFYTFEN